MSPRVGSPAQMAAATSDQLPSQAARCRRKFLRYFPRGFQDEQYAEWERGYKWRAHQAWHARLSRGRFSALLAAENHREVARIAVGTESRTNLLFSFEKMAIRDAVKSEAGAASFARGLFHFLHGRGNLAARFDEWCAILAALPRKQTRVRTWPVATVFGFIGDPAAQVFLKPTVTRRAAEAYGFELDYRSQPSWTTYESVLGFCTRLRADMADLRPRDMIDLQSFIWVTGSDEYPWKRSDG